MDPISIVDAKTQLSRLVDAVASGREREVVIARHGRPVARLVPLQAASGGIRLGVAKGLFVLPDDISQHRDEVACLFLGPGV
jgi:prevent-host-death family protein